MQRKKKYNIADICITIHHQTDQVWYFFREKNILFPIHSMIWDIFYFQPVFLSRFSAHPNSSTFDSKLDTVDRLFFHFGLMKHFLQKYLCHLRQKRKHGRCYIHGVIDSYNNVCFRWETEDLSSADEDVPTDDISVSSSSKVKDCS